MHFGHDGGQFTFLHPLGDFEQSVHFKFLENLRGLLGLHVFVNFNQAQKLGVLLRVEGLDQTGDGFTQYLELFDLFVDPGFRRRQQSGSEFKFLFSGFQDLAAFGQLLQKIDFRRRQKCRVIGDQLRYLALGFVLQRRRDGLFGGFFSGRGLAVLSRRFGVFLGGLGDCLGHLDGAVNVPVKPIPDVADFYRQHQCRGKDGEWQELYP